MPPEALYTEVLKDLAPLGLGLSAEGTHGLAAILVLGRFLERAIAEFKRARNRAGRAINALNMLLQKPHPLISADTEDARAKLAEVRDDPVLMNGRTSGDVAAGVPGVPHPGKAGVDGMVGCLAAPPADARSRIEAFVRSFESYACGCVGNTSSIIVDVDRVGRFILGGERDMRADEFQRWIVNEVASYLEAARGSVRGAVRDAERVMMAALPDLASDDEQPQLGRVRWRAQRSFGKGLPSAPRLIHFAKLAARLDELRAAQ